MSVLFFFFKQKTAYEMRISDWSSDVCSSDLQRVIVPFGERRDVHRRELPDLQRVVPAVVEALQLHFLADVQPELEEIDPLIDDHEIGRASCRERVCQYV